MFLALPNFRDLLSKLILYLARNFELFDLLRRRRWWLVRIFRLAIFTDATDKKKEKKDSRFQTKGFLSSKAPACYSLDGKELPLFRSQDLLHNAS